MYQRKRLDLLAALHASLSPLFLGQLKNLHKLVASQYAKDLAAGLKEPGYDFADVVQKGMVKAQTAFLDGAKGESHLVHILAIPAYCRYRGSSRRDGLGV